MRLPVEMVKMRTWHQRGNRKRRGRRTWTESETLVVGNDLEATILVNADARVGSAQVDTDHGTDFRVVGGERQRQERENGQQHHD